MSGFQQITILGNVGRDPEMRYLASGDPLTTFSLAVNRNFKDKSGERQESTEWFECVAFGNQAEIVNNYVAQGNQLLVTGRIQTDKWVGDDGSKHQKQKVVVGTVTLMGKPKAE